MPRQNRLEVTPPPAHAHSGQTKAQITAQGVDGRVVTKLGYFMYPVRANLTHMVSNNTQPHQNLSLHAYEVLAYFGLSMSSEALTQLHVSTQTHKPVAPLALIHVYLCCYSTGDWSG